MICAEFFRKNGSPVGFRISGHSGASEAGTDIVCAAVSSAAYLTANTVTDIMNVSAKASVTDGTMVLRISEKGTAGMRCAAPGISPSHDGFARTVSKEYKVNRHGGVMSC